MMRKALVLQRLSLLEEFQMIRVDFCSKNPYLTPYEPRPAFAMNPTCFSLLNISMGQVLLCWAEDKH